MFLIVRHPFFYRTGYSSTTLSDQSIKNNPVIQLTNQPVTLSASLRKAIEWAHFFAQPFAFPIFGGDEFSGCFYSFTCKPSEGKTGRTSENTAEFFYTVCHK
jgi:hypothetical protein